MKYRGIVISDTSCLIALERIDAFYLFEELFETVTITNEVAEEFGKTLPDYFEIRDASKELTGMIQATGLDLGESSAIALALTLENCLLLIDEEKARKEAIRRNINVTGMMGILLRAKKNGVIKSIKPTVDLMKANGFRLSNTLIQETLHEAGEA